jgi:hypothetical protein
VRFDVSEAGSGLSVSTDIDFRFANELYHQVVPPAHSSLSAAYLLAHVIAAREALEAAAIQDAEIATDPAHAIAAATTLQFVLDRARKSSSTIASFQDFVFEDGKALREAVNSGTKSLKDLLTLLTHARRFRDWISTQPPDTDLMKAYYKECVRDTWVDKLPGKSVRWLLFTGLGAAIDAAGAGGLGTAIGLTVSAGDAFLLDRMIRGWRPSQFVEKKLRDYVRRSP